MLHARNDIVHIYNSARAEALVDEIIPVFERMEEGI